MTRSFRSPESGRRAILPTLMFNTMYRRGTVAATHVAELPQEICYRTLAEQRIRQRSQIGTDVQRPNTGFAGHRGPQLPSKHHTSTRRIYPRLVITPKRTSDRWHSNWINAMVIHPVFLGAVLVDRYTEIRRARISSVAGDYERAR